MEFLQKLLYAIIAAAVPVITTFVCKFLQSLYEEHRSKVKNERAQIVLGQVVEMIGSAVETTTSTYVKQLKASDLFDEEAQKQAFQKTYETVRCQLTNEATSIIEEVYSDVETFLTTKIEQMVEQLKK